MATDDPARLELLDQGHIDHPTFEQILEMDEDGDNEFSKSIVYGFFDQADNTFLKIENAFETQNLTELSHLGHFLKGSSATLGLFKVKDGCEKIQNYGSKKDNQGEPFGSRKTDADLVGMIKSIFMEVKSDYKISEKMLRRFYGEKI